MAEVPFRPARQLSEYKGKGASASREKTAAKETKYPWALREIPTPSIDQSQGALYIYKL